MALVVKQEPDLSLYLCNRAGLRYGKFLQIKGKVRGK